MTDKDNLSTTFTTVYARRKVFAKIRQIWHKICVMFDKHRRNCLDAAKMKRLLLVDDNYNFCTTLQLGLKNECFKVDITTNSFEAVSRLQTHIYDVLVTDIKMPKLSGDGLAKIAISFQPKIKVILMSAFDFTDLELGGELDKYPKISKPFQIKSLIYLINN